MKTLIGITIAVLIALGTGASEAQAQYVQLPPPGSVSV